MAADRTELRRRAAQQAKHGNYWAGKALALLDQLDAAEADLAKARADEYRCAHCRGQLLCMRCD